MISLFPLFSSRTRGGAVFITALLGLAAAPMARATLFEFEPSTIVPNDTFSIELVAYNTTTPSGDIYAIQPGLTPTFGTTQTFANDALGGQTLTVTSMESTSAGITTDTIAIGVPTNFIPAGTTDNNGNVINALEFSIGNYLGGTNTLDFSTALTAPVSTGAVVFKLNGLTTAAALTQNPILSNGNKSYSDEEAVQSASTTTPISGSNITSFSITLTYAVPEPSTIATVVLGAAGLLWLAIRRRSARA